MNRFLNMRLLHEAEWGQWLAVVALPLVATIAFLVLRSYDLIDDAYITAHYAQNLALGNGWVWNAGTAPTDGTTAPLWTVILAAILVLHLPFVTTVHIVVSLCYGFMAFCACLLAWRLGGHVATLVCCIAFLLLAVLLPASSGMETVLYGTIVVAVLLCWDLGYQRLALVSAGFLPLVRGEGIILLGLLFLALIVTRQAIALWKTALIALIPSVAWELFSYSEFHALLPNSFLAKHAQTIGIAGKITAKSFVSGLILSGWTPASALWMFLGAAVTIWIARRHRTVLLAGAWLLCYIVFYTIIANVPQQPWYVLPSWWVAALLLAVGVSNAIAGKASGNQRNVLVITVIGVCVILGFAPGPSLLWDAIHRARPLADPRREAAQILSHRPGGLVAAAEIGLLGFYSDHPVADIEGLVNPEVVPHLAQRDYGWLIRHNKPRYVMLWEPPRHRPCVYEVICVVWGMPWFRQHYHVLKSWPYEETVTDAYDLLVYQELKYSAGQ